MAIHRKTNAEQALALWVEWFGKNRDPFIPSEMDGNPYCFFCFEDQYDKEAHEPDCIYARAKALVENSA